MPRLLSKVIQPAIGLAAEAIAHQREKSRSRSDLAEPGPNAGGHAPSSSASASHPASQARQAGPVDPNAPPPQYTETSDQGLLESGGPAYHDEKRAIKHDKSYAEYDEEDDDDAEHDEDDWDLDEAAELASPPSYDQTLDNDDIPALTRSVLKGAKAPTGVNLPLPVIIPQRRPRDKKRGFVRAYAPVLEDTGIDQDTFLRFLKAFHQSSQSSKYWDVIFISAGIAGFAPSAIAMAVSTAVQIAAGTAKELQARKRTNSFLDEMNQKLFMPRGLIALIMTFKPDIPPSAQRSGPISGVLGALGGLVAHQELDMNQSIAKYYMDDSVSGMKKSMQGLRLSSGKTHGELAMPEAAPLIYPTLEEVADAVARGREGEEEVKKKSAFQRSGKFVADYFDRRAQARYASENPGSSLSSPEGPHFASRLADPAYQSQHRGLLSTLSGGAVGGGRRERRAQRRAYGDERRIAYGRAPRGPRKLKEGDPGYQPQGVKRLMQQDVLYLTIVNMPTDEELQLAVATMNSLQSQK